MTLAHLGGVKIGKVSSHAKTTINKYTQLQSMLSFNVIGTCKNNNKQVHTITINVEF